MEIETLKLFLEIIVNNQHKPEFIQKLAKDLLDRIEKSETLSV